MLVLLLLFVSWCLSVLTTKALRHEGLKVRVILEGIVISTKNASMHPLEKNLNRQLEPFFNEIQALELDQEKKKKKIKYLIKFCNYS